MVSLRAALLVSLFSTLATAQTATAPAKAMPAKPPPDTARAAPAATLRPVTAPAASEPVKVVLVERAPEQDLPKFEIALKAGGHFPEGWNKLGPSFDVVLKVGYAPLEDRRLQAFVEAGYTQPSKTTTGNDPRLGAAGADYSTTLKVQDLTTRLGAQWSFLGTLPVTPYAGAALRVDFVKSVVTGTGGATFNEYRETGTQFGGTVFGGVTLRLWHGTLLGELSLNYTPIKQRVTEKANIGATSLLLGYGFWL